MYEDGSLKFKKKSPSCLMTTRRPGDSFITTSDVPEAGKYSPVDTFYSRRRSSSQFGFGSSKRFNYSLSRIEVIKWIKKGLDQAATNPTINQSRLRAQSATQRGRPMQWRSWRRAFLQGLSIMSTDDLMNFVAVQISQY